MTSKSTETSNSSKQFLKVADRLSYVPIYSFAKLDAEKQSIIKTGADVIDLSLGSPNLLSPKVVIDEAINQIQNPANYKYPPFKGSLEFKEAASSWLHKRFGIDIDAGSEILPLTGSKEGITHLAFAFINPGDLTIVPSPYYPVHARGTLLAGGHIHELPLKVENNFLPEIDKIPQSILDHAKMFFISYPNNPTGAVCDFEFLEKVVYLCKKNNIILVNDLAYSELVFDQNRAHSIFEIKDAKDVAVEFHTLSKTYSMAGWRMAFVIGNKNIINALYEVKTNTDYGVCGIIQAASIKAFSIPLSEHKKTSMIYQERRDVMLGKLTSLGWNIPKPGGAMYIWLPIPSLYKSGFDFSSDLLHKAKIASIPGGSFGTFGEKYIRFALVDHKERLSEAVDRMKNEGLTYN